MSFKEVSSLDADVTVALGKKDKNTGKAYPKQAEGYYLGKRVVQNKRGDSVLHFLQTAEGNLGLWGTTDMNRKLSSIVPGVMVRITSTGTKATPKGDMFTYKVEHDSSNTIEVNITDPVSSSEDDTGSVDGSSAADYSVDDSSDEDNEQTAALVAAERAAAAAKVQAILNRGKQAKTK